MMCHVAVLLPFPKILTACEDGFRAPQNSRWKEYECPQEASRCVWFLDSHSFLVLSVCCTDVRHIAGMCSWAFIYYF